MAINAYEVLSSNQSLKEKLDSNYDVSDFLMSFYKQIEIVASESPKDPKNLMCSVDITQERLLMITTRYYEPGESSHSTDRHPSKRNINIAKLFEVNHNVRDVAARVVDVLERWLAAQSYRKGSTFEDIKVVNGMHWSGDHTFTAELVLKINFDEYVQRRLKTDMPAEQVTEQEAEQLAEAQKKAEELPEIDLQWRKQ